MRICCGLAGHLELARHRDLYGTPVVVGDADGHVLAVSEEALPFSVEPGIPVRQAEHLCPHATLLTSDPIEADRLRERIAAALYDLAPCVEVRVDGIAWLDLEGVPSPSASIREARRRLRTAIGREPRLGLAPGPFSARLAAARALYCSHAGSSPISSLRGSRRCSRALTGSSSRRSRTARPCSSSRARCVATSPRNSDCAAPAPSRCACVSTAKTARSKHANPSSGIRSAAPRSCSASRARG